MPVTAYNWLSYHDKLIFSEGSFFKDGCYGCGMVMWPVWWNDIIEETACNFNIDCNVNTTNTYSVQYVMDCGPVSVSTEQFTLMTSYAVAAQNHISYLPVYLGKYRFDNNQTNASGCQGLFRKMGLTIPSNYMALLALPNWVLWILNNNFKGFTFIYRYLWSYHILPLLTKSQSIVRN